MVVVVIMVVVMVTLVVDCWKVSLLITNFSTRASVKY